jgi:hypothetical protein
VEERGVKYKEERTMLGLSPPKTSWLIGLQASPGSGSDVMDRTGGGHGTGLNGTVGLWVNSTVVGGRRLWGSHIGTPN